MVRRPEKGYVKQIDLQVEPNDHVLYLDVKRYLANQRQGTAKSKERSEHAGSLANWVAKGGGGAAVVISIPCTSGGGRMLIPKPSRDYRFKLNKKVKVLARKSALSYAGSENAIIVVEDFSFFFFLTQRQKIS